MIPLWLIAPALKLRKLGPVIVRNWKPIAIVVAVCVFFVVACRRENAAERRGYAAMKVECEAARQAANDAVSAAQTASREEGRQAGIIEGKRLADNEDEIRADGAQTLEEIEAALLRLRPPPPVTIPGQPIMIDTCALNPEALSEITGALNARRQRLNEGLR